MRVKACGGCNLRLQYICGKLCNCCYKGENLQWLQYTGAGNYATAVMRGKTCGGYNTSVVNYATAAMHGKACGGCNLRLQYICGKLCNCCYKGENLQWLQYTGAGNYATAVMRGKTCSTSAGNYATGAMRGKNCDGCKRGNTQLMLSEGIHANCRCKHTVCFRSGKRALALTCSLRTVWTLEGVFWTF